MELESLEAEYERVHSYKSSKMWDTLALAYDRASQWRAHVTTLKASKDLKKLMMEELLGTIKVYEIELNEDEGHRKGKSIVLKAQKALKGSSSKAFKVEESFEEASEEERSNLDKLSFILRKIHFVLKKKGGS
ncbi:hypothetical protein CR513_38328, partial [Mucuna pruriens]